MLGSRLSLVTTVPILSILQKSQLVFDERTIMLLEWRRSRYANDTNFQCLNMILRINWWLQEGREGREFGSKKGQNDRSSLTNKIKSKRNKAFMMIVHKRDVKSKAKRSLQEKQVRFYLLSISFEVKTRLTRHWNNSVLSGLMSRSRRWRNRPVYQIKWKNSNFELNCLYLSSWIPCLRRKTPAIPETAATPLMRGRVDGVVRIRWLRELKWRRAFLILLLFEACSRRGKNVNKQRP